MGLPGTTNTLRPSRSRTESAGVTSGLSRRSDEAVLDGVTKDVDYANGSTGAAAGGYKRQALGKRVQRSVKEKGYNFTFC